MRFAPRGNQLELFHSHAREFILCGPAGTGKTLAALHKVHLCSLKYPGMRSLMVRKTRESLTQSALVSFNRKVQPQLNGAYFHHQDQEYRYPSGSVVIVGGLDKPTKVMSSEYDLIYVVEATELEEEDYEALTTRLRDGVMGYRQLIGDCNPDAPTHWLRQRANRAEAAGKPIMHNTRHEDNPALWDGDDWTELGREYMATLDDLSGVRYLRFRKGIWAAAEGLVYDGWDSAVHVIPRTGIHRGWPRYWVVDFGYTNPFVWQAWARDPDGRLYRYREIYRTQRLVEDHAKEILRLTEGEPRPLAVICDHDAEDRATLERHLKMRTVGAFKSVSPGIQAVATRLKKAGDGRPRLLLLAGSLDERDKAREAKRKPCCTEEEMDGYIWDISNGRRKGEAPVKEEDHGADAVRYLVAHVDKIDQEPKRPMSGASAGTRPENTYQPR